MRLQSLPRAHTIRSRLLLFLISSVVLTALAISVVTAVVGFRSGRDRAMGQLQSVAILKENEIRAWADGLSLNLDIVLSQGQVLNELDVLLSPEIPRSDRDAAYSALQDSFQWGVHRMGLFQEVFFMDAEGVVRVSTDASHEGQRLGLNDYFTQGMKGKFIQQPSYSLSLGRLTVVASAPVAYQGQMMGVIAGRADLSGLNEIMIERTGLGETAETYLVGSNYGLLTYLREPGHSIPETYVNTTGTRAAVSLHRGGSAVYQGYSGQKVIGVYRWIPDLKVALIAEQDEAEALGTTRTMLIVLGGVAGLAVVLALLAAIALTRRIVRPLAQLGTTAGRIADGELDLEAPVIRDDEIGTLARAFNRMTARLRGLVRNLERRTDHLRAINESGRQISSILQLDQLLPHVARSLLEKFTYKSVRIFLLSGEGQGRLLTCVGDEAQCTELETLDLSDPVASPVLTRTVTTGEATLIPLLPADEAPGEETDGNARYSQLAVPIAMKDRLLGVLDIQARVTHPLDAQDIFAASTLADQLAVAIENSRLYEHADELAASRERQRLARDLHDAVSQTLFSVSLIAEVLPRIYEKDQDQGRERLEELRLLTRGALAEMRTLLLELRPAALAEANLADLLRQLGEAVVSRARIPVEVDAGPGSEDLPSDVRVALYRIAQEALNNVAKHSGAKRARVSFSSTSAGVRLVIEDDGVGFTPLEATAGQLGLAIMRERAESFGGTLTINSAARAGTAVVLTWAPMGNPPDVGGRTAR